MDEKSVSFEAEGGDGESQWSYRAAIMCTDEDTNRVSIEMDAAHEGHELHLCMSLDDVLDSSSRVCEKVRNWMSRRPGFPTDARLTIERFLTEQMPAQLVEVANQEPGNQCVVCLTSLQNGSPLKRLDCSHEFHRDCVDRWLVTLSNCPVCRRSIRTADNADNAGEIADFRNRILEMGRLANRLADIRDHNIRQPPQIDNVSNHRRGNVSNTRGFNVFRPLLFGGISALLTGIFIVLLKPASASASASAPAPAPASAPAPAPESLFSFSFSKFGIDMDIGMYRE